MAKDRSNSAFTLTELVVLLAVSGVLLALILPAMRPPRRVSAPGIKCVNNLKNVGLACRIFATDHGDRFPAQVSTNEGGCAEFRSSPEAIVRYFQSISNELSTPKIIVCPADTRKPAQTFAELQHANLSYFIGWLAEESLPQMLLAGDRFISQTNGWVILETNTVAGPTPALHGYFNVALADGSVQQLSSARLSQLARTNTAVTNLVVLP